MNNTNFFQPLENTRPFLKAAFEGFSGTGKSFTAGLVAVGLHDLLKSTKPIAIYYTERAGRGALTHFFNTVHKKQAIIRESRSLVDLLQTIKLCEEGASDILLIDSITHVWESFIAAYMKEKRISRIQFHHWGQIKPDWKSKFSDTFLEAQLHIIFTGRAGYEYDHYEDEEGVKQLEKTGVKMKVEGETEYEPDLVVLMEKVKSMDRNQMKIDRRALIVKDRNNVIDGKSFMNPDFKIFQKTIEIMLSGTAKKENFNETNDSFGDDSQFEQARKQRVILLEEIKAIFDQLELGTSVAAKAFKADLSEKIFKVRSWTAVEELPMNDLQSGKNLLDSYKAWFVEYFRGRKSEGLDLNKDDALAYLEKMLSPAPTQKQSPAQTQSPVDQWAQRDELPKRGESDDFLPGFNPDEAVSGGTAETETAASTNGAVDLF